MAQESTVPFKINMPAGLRERLGAVAEQSGRSLTAEIITRLEKSFEADDEWSNALNNIEDLVARVELLEAAVQAHDEQISPGKYDWK